MRISLASVLDVAASVAFVQVKRPALLHYVAHPLIRFLPITPFPATWQEGTYETEMRLFGLIPLGSQLIRIELPNQPADGSFQLRDNGQGHLASTWDHWIFIEPINEGQCRYIDNVTIRAGLLTVLVWAFAQGFYAWRQYRWKQLTRLHFQPINRLKHEKDHCLLVVPLLTPADAGPQLLARTQRYRQGRRTDDGSMLLRRTRKRPARKSR